MKQTSFLPKQSMEHGGDTRTGKRKVVRPFDRKRPLHVVMKATRARGPLSMLSRRNARAVESLVSETAQRAGVRVYRFTNVGNHLHLLLKAPSRRQFQRFLRVLAGRIAFHVTGAKKGNAQGKFWDKTAYSRLLTWGLQYDQVHSYLLKNALEAIGFFRGRAHLKKELCFLSVSRLAKRRSPKR